MSTASLPTDTPRNDTKLDELCINTVRTLAMDANGTTVRARFGVDQLLADIAPGGEVRTVEAHVRAFGTSGSAPLRERQGSAMRRVCRQGSAVYLITVTKNHKGHLVIAVAPVTPRRVIARLRSRLPLGGN